MTLEEKLNKSINEVEKLLDETVIIKLVCIINNNILLDSNKLLPSIILKKGQIDNNIINIFNGLLNITINNISLLPFNKYNNYNERYYIIEIDKEDIISLNNKYSFDNIDNMSSIEEKEIIS